MADSSTSSRKLQILLQPDMRGAASRAAAVAAMRSSGLDISGEGAVSLSARIDSAKFDALFGSAAQDGTVNVPASLAKYVSSISEAPEHIEFE